MRMPEAAKATLAVAVSKGYDAFASDLPELDYPHIKYMIDYMEENEETMAPAKIGLWLGWIQCAIVRGTKGAVSLEDCIRINNEHSED